MPPTLEPAILWCRALLRRTRRNRRRLVLLAALQSLLVGSLVSAVLLQLTRDPPLLRGLLLGSLAALLLGWVVAAVRVTLRTRSVRAFAAGTERRAATFRSALVTAVEIAESGDTSPPPWVLKGLAAQIEEGRAAAEACDLAEAVPVRRATRVVGLTLLLTACAVLLHTEIIERGLRVLVLGPPASRHEARRVVRLPAVVEDLRVTRTPPAYTHLPGGASGSFSGSLSALRGTEITLRGRLAMPEMRALEVELPGETEPQRRRVRLRGRSFELRLSLDRSGPFEFIASAGPTRIWRQQRPYLIEVQPDAHPLQRESVRRHVCSCRFGQHFLRARPDSKNGLFNRSFVGLV